MICPTCKQNTYYETDTDTAIYGGCDSCDYKFYFEKPATVMSVGIITIYNRFAEEIHRIFTENVEENMNKFFNDKKSSGFRPGQHKYSAVTDGSSYIGTIYNIDINTGEIR